MKINYFSPKKSELSVFFKHDKKKFFQTSFYKDQRKKLNILINEQGLPEEENGPMTL